MQKRRGRDVAASLEAECNSENGKERVSVRDKAMQDRRERERVGWREKLK